MGFVSFLNGFSVLNYKSYSKKITKRFTEYVLAFNQILSTKRELHRRRCISGCKSFECFKILILHRKEKKTCNWIRFGFQSKFCRTKREVRRRRCTLGSGRMKKLEICFKNTQNRRFFKNLRDLRQSRQKFQIFWKTVES